MKHPVSTGKRNSESDTHLGDYEKIESDESDTNDLLDSYNQENDDTSSSEEEVLRVHSESESEDSEDQTSIVDGESDGDDNNISDSDMEDADDDLPDAKAWGKIKKRYYNADHINDKNDFLNEEDEKVAKMEEEEAISIQKRLISEIDSADLSLDLLTDVIAEKKEQDFKEKERIEINLSEMNEQEKLKLLKRECPELLIYLEDYKRLMLLLRDELLPTIQFLKTNKLNSSNVGEFVTSFNQLITNYCTNIVFYLLLKCRRADTKSHPVSKWIAQYQNMLNETEPVYTNTFQPLIRQILSGKLNPKELINKKKQTNFKSKKLNKFQAEENEIHESDDKIQQNAANEYDDVMLMDGEDENDESKRPITYEMAKNKGLTPHRKKELRNPRVKHRMKYRKAKIRRKGQVREVRKELQKYAGEISGIKAGVIKSVKFKS